MSSETGLWKWLKNYCPQGHYTRVETGETGPGTPDVNYRIAKAEGWIELKDAKHPWSSIPFPDHDRGLRKSQEIWIAEHVKFGGLVHIAAQIGHQILFIPGKYARYFNGAERHRLDFFSVLTLDKNNPAPSLKKLKKLLEGEVP